MRLSELSPFTRAAISSASLAGLITTGVMAASEIQSTNIDPSIASQKQPNMQPSRSHEHPRLLFKGENGALVADPYLTKKAFPSLTTLRFHDVKTKQGDELTIFTCIQGTSKSVQVAVYEHSNRGKSTNLIETVPLNKQSNCTEVSLPITRLSPSDTVAIGTGTTEQAAVTQMDQFHFLGNGKQMQEFYTGITSRQLPRSLLGKHT